VSQTIHWFFTTGLCAIGFAVSVCYIWASYRRSSGENPSATSVTRPWRRRGAIICAVVSVLFYLGMHHVSPYRWPRVYIVLWIVVLLLVLWLCIIAAADMLYTRRITRETLQKSRRSR
jgi:hypothetical protein